MRINILKNIRSGFINLRVIHLKRTTNKIDIIIPSTVYIRQRSSNTANWQ